MNHDIIFVTPLLKILIGKIGIIIAVNVMKHILVNVFID